MLANFPVQGKGLGLRRGLLPALASETPQCVDFYEVAPENWIDVGGQLGRRFRDLTARYPFICHGLSLNLGGTAALNEPLLQRIKTFLQEHGIKCYSEHLSYCCDDGYLYDLMPIPFTEAAIRHVVARIQRTQDLLGQAIAIENVSYYCAPGAEMSELEFINEILRSADCKLLLDVNNIYVNSVNHGYDAAMFLRGLPGERIAYGHIAGHYNEADDLIVDTHGAAIIDPVWDLLAEAYAVFGVFPTLVERDFNLPPLAELLREVEHIGRLQRRAAGDGVSSGARSYA